MDEKSRFKGKITPYASKASSEVTMELINRVAAHGVEFETGITVSSPGL